MFVFLNVNEGVIICIICTEGVIICNYNDVFVFVYLSVCLAIEMKRN